MILFKKFVLLVVVFPLLLACEPTVVVKNNGPDIGDVVIPKPSALQRDQFSYEKPSGKLNLLFVADNTDSAHVIEKMAGKIYLGLVNKLSGEEARLLDFRYQVVTNPATRTPNYPFTNSLEQYEENNKCHMHNLFGTPNCDGVMTAPVFSSSDAGDLNVGAAWSAGLQDAAFLDRSNDYFMTVLLLTHDDWRDQSSQLPFLSGALNNARSDFHHHVVTLSRQRGLKDCPNTLKNIFKPAPRALAFVEGVAKQVQHWNLCESVIDSNPWGFEPQNLVDRIWDSMMKVKSRIVLSQRAYKPESMVVQTHSRRYVFGRDYEYDTGSNEIRWLRPPGLKPGDFVEVSYWLGPPIEGGGDEPLSGPGI